MLAQLLLYTFFILSGNTTAHEFHVSKCQVEYSDEDKTLQVTMHIYLDDLEEALRKKGADKLFICTDREAASADEHLVDYFKERFHIKINNTITDFTFIGKEPSEDLQAAWCYLEFPATEAIKNITIENVLLMEVFDDQKNIVSILAPNKEQGYFLFEKGKAVETMHFD